ncbi:GHKL domain-containing protein [Streptococcus penaeicida]|uniref:GHKL domain-containing protein n=1 Tax=Streptococcus penaeicida TaxID=1765960 RepID=UPI001FE4BB88|nr:GHKL domain-containing protein [Streptococcus penaeicida]
MATVKSFLAAKLFEAQNQGIEVAVEIPDVISEIKMNLLDFIILLSIFFDNAIEEAKESHEKKISVVFFTEDKQLNFYIENSTRDVQININQIFQEGFSSKGSNRGIGLSNVLKILDDYPFCSLTTKSANYKLSQKLSILVY